MTCQHLIFKPVDRDAAALHVMPYISSTMVGAKSRWRYVWITTLELLQLPLPCSSTRSCSWQSSRALLKLSQQKVGLTRYSAKSCSQNLKNVAILAVWMKFCNVPKYVPSLSFREMNISCRLYRSSRRSMELERMYLSKPKRLIEKITPE